ncbi:hypothetical protein BST81_20775 [Leptolyngbya sp. 'hensonii']|uniref:DUF3747 domain-containing protein n=1 Tax=Leptolyngbya sp. 'hensonii' TaxID=1922337 RepID=UPI00094FFEDF|nr:DUF3747 domain-containing protein [Leptolyngbya sp. 'hensonii']OLP16422.1 hypothetical protein BST81_20775 [Leptolyngbya sp. 'hensonii']
MNSCKIVAWPPIQERQALSYLVAALAFLLSLDITTMKRHLLNLGLTSAALALTLNWPLPSLDLAGRWQPSGAAVAQFFGQEEVDSSKFVLIASPIGNTGNYQLLIVEQLSFQKNCWAESGSNPVIVDPLLLQFDFTRICSRSTDSNGYSIRMAGRDLGLMYALSIVRQNNELLLIGTNVGGDRKAPVLLLGRTNGLPPAGQFVKINLVPGWRLTKRVFKDKVLGHVYLTTDTIVAGIKLPDLATFADTTNHWARNYIETLASRGIITGFPDGTFRPEEPVTRVQYAIIVSKAFSNIPASRPPGSFKDLAPNYWGLQAIRNASQQGFISGYPDGTFQPNQNISRVQALVSLASGLNLKSANTSLLNYYQDVAQIPAYAASAIAATTERQIVVNYPEVRQLNPNRPATRAEVAAFVYQALASTGRVQAVASPYVVLVNP